MSSRSGSRTSGSVPGAAVVHTHTEADVTNLTTDLATKLAKASNLSDLASAATARARNRRRAAGCTRQALEC